MSNKYLDLAYEYAKKALNNNEVPVGAIVVKDNKVIGVGYNTKETNNDISGHAEINALKDASKNINDYYLEGCDLYVTLEPCLMCASAIQQSHISKIYYGALDKKNGAIESIIHSLDLEGLNHYVKYEYLNDDKCSQILKDFFKAKRYNK